MTERRAPQPASAPVALSSPRDWLRQGGSVLLLAPARGGTGAALARVIPAADRRRILRWQVRPYDRRSPLRALNRLLAAVPDTVLYALAPPARDVLVELRDGPRPVAPVPVLFVQCAVLSLVRILAEKTPLLLVVDGVQWLDPDSAQVLRFLATHVRGLPALVQVAAVEQRRSATAPAGVQMCPPPLLMIRLGRPANRRAGPAGYGPGRTRRIRLTRPT